MILSGPKGVVVVVSAKWHFDFGTTLEANQHSILPRKLLIEEDLRWVTDVGWVGADSADPRTTSASPVLVPPAGVFSSDTP